MNLKKQNSLHELFQKLAIGIGEVSDIIGVSQRQLRYWEKKGYIKPVEQRSGVRRYSLATVYLIAYMKDRLDEGYTLSAAYEKSKDVQIKSKIYRKFFNMNLDNVNITNAQKAYGEIDLGLIHTDKDKTQHFRGIVDQTGTYYKVEK